MSCDFCGCFLVFFFVVTCYHVCPLCLWHMGDDSFPLFCNMDFEASLFQFMVDEFMFIVLSWFYKSI